MVNSVSAVKIAGKMSAGVPVPHAQEALESSQQQQGNASNEVRPAIKIENLSKEFAQLVELDYLTAKESWSHIRGVFSSKGRSPDGHASQLRIAKGRLSIPSLEIRPGSVVGITGPTGAGKTVFLHVLAGLVPASEGRIELCGEVSFVFGGDLDRRLTARENIDEAFRYSHWKPADLDEIYRKVMDFANLHDYEHLKVGEYSSGMMLRFSLALSLQTDPDIWLIDDVLGVADLKFQLKSKEVLRNMRRSGRTIVFASHDDVLIAEIADRVILFDAGEIVFDGSPGELAVLRETGAKKYLWQIAGAPRENDAVVFVTASAVLVEPRLVLRANIECEVKANQKLALGVEVRHGREAFLKIDLTDFIDADRGRKVFHVDIPLETLNEHIYSVDLIIASEVGRQVETLRVHDFLRLEVTEGRIVGKRHKEPALFSFHFPLDLQPDGKAGQS
jgi:lipopolysaccharide transport system ATP-binding protein